MKKRRIYVVTGTRAEYGLLYPVIKSIKEHPKLTLLLLAAGMHLDKRYGRSVREIKKDGFKIDAKVKMSPRGETSFDMAKAIGEGVVGFSKAFRKLKPDIVVVLGDRIEALSASIASAYMNIPLAHLHGGDSARAGLDESARHAITKFAHIHFPTTKKSAERIIRLGEDGKKVYVVGAPGLDTILNQKYLTRDQLGKKFHMKPEEKFILLVQHPISTEPELAGKQMIETMKAIKELRMKTIIIYPNSDSGGKQIIEAIKGYQNLDFIFTYKNLPHNDYLSLMKYAAVMMGNSSSGIIESSSFKLPVVNIGIRQEDRERSTNVIDVNHDKEKIIGAIKEALSPEFKEKLKNCVSPYGDGKTGPRVAKILAEIEINEKLLQKKLAY